MVKLLNDRQIGQKITRLAIEIVEQNWETSKIVLAGINSNGFFFAGLILKEIKNYDPNFQIDLVNVSLNPANPLSEPITCDQPAATFNGQNVILVDDVANTGRTIFYAFSTFIQALPRKVQICVLIDRKHKTFPVHVDYVGLSLATTLQEHIDVQLDTISGGRQVLLD
jgi:pyrimidine operon attenuation protein / uracil phosphoribosyltransferase